MPILYFQCRLWCIISLFCLVHREMLNGRASYHPVPPTMPPAAEHRPQLSITPYSPQSAEPVSCWLAFSVFLTRSCECIGIHASYAVNSYYVMLQRQISVVVALIYRGWLQSRLLYDRFIYLSMRLSYDMDVF